MNFSRIRVRSALKYNGKFPVFLYHCCVVAGVLFIINLPFLTTTTYVLYQKKTIQKEVKKMMMATLPEEKFVTLAFTVEEAREQLRWKHDREFEYKGFMYDIASRKIKGDTIYFLCWLDKAETELNKELKNIVLQAISGHPGKNQSQKNLADYHKSLICQPLEIMPRVIFVFQKKNTFFLTATWLDWYENPTHDPPELDA